MIVLVCLHFIWWIRFSHKTQQNATHHNHAMKTGCSLFMAIRLPKPIGTLPRKKALVEFRDVLTSTLLFNCCNSGITKSCAFFAGFVENRSMSFVSLQQYLQLEHKSRAFLMIWRNRCIYSFYALLANIHWHTHTIHQPCQWWFFFHVFFFIIIVSVSVVWWSFLLHLYIYVFHSDKLLAYDFHAIY